MFRVFALVIIGLVGISFAYAQQAVTGTIAPVTPKVEAKKEDCTKVTDKTKKAECEKAAKKAVEPAKSAASTEPVKVEVTAPKK